MSEKTIDFFIDGKPLTAREGQTVIQAARDHGIFIPHFCWHPDLSVPGNCRVCLVEVESDKGDPWFDIGCNMPVTAGMRVRLDSEMVKGLRKDVMQFITLNHPVDCGICSKAGECILQDYHYAYNGNASTSLEPKLPATKFYPLSDRIMLDNERCIKCTRCIRFTDEISKSHALGMVNRGDDEIVRPAEDANFNDDVYSDNVIDICPVGALLSRKDQANARVWYTEATPSVCPGCSRGCNIEIWHRNAHWQLKALDPALNTRIERVTPRDNYEVNGPWVCNKARDLAQIFERPRAVQALVSGSKVATKQAIAVAAGLLGEAKRVVALVSTWGSNEELEAFHSTVVPMLGRKLTAWVKSDHLPQPGEVLEDDLLIKADKNPNRKTAARYFSELPEAGFLAIPSDTDVLLVWGEGAASAALPDIDGMRVIRLDSWEHDDNRAADVFIPISIQTERDGHYTNFEGVVSSFSTCFTAAPGVAHAEELFGMLAAGPATAGAPR